MTQQEVYCVDTLNQGLGSLVDTVKVAPLLTPEGGVSTLLRSLRSRRKAILLHHVAVIQASLARLLGLLRPPSCATRILVITRRLTGKVRNALSGRRVVTAPTLGIA
jgi:hypothetical protein